MGGREINFKILKYASDDHSVGKRAVSISSDVNHITNNGIQQVYIMEYQN